jgi:hypothetical protein
MKIQRLDGEAQPTLQGLTRGYVKVRSNGKLKPCVVFGQSFPSWLPVLSELGFEVALVLLCTDEHLSKVEAFVGDKCAIWCGSDWGAFGATVPDLSGRECCNLVDGRVTGEAMSLFSSMLARQVVETKRARRGFTGWPSAQIGVPHSEVGGITAHHATMEGFQQTTEALLVEKLLYVVGRDASTVLSVMEVSRRYRRAPCDRTVLTLDCVNLGSGSHPEYHGGGLLPGMLDKLVQVSTPTLFAKPGYWGLRSLSNVEILLAKDLSEADSGKLKDVRPKVGFLRSFTPGKCLVFGFRALFNGGGTVDNSQPETITQFAHAHEDELWCQGKNLEVSDRDGSAVGASGGKTAKRPERRPLEGEGQKRSQNLLERIESPRKELVGSCEVGNLGEVSPPGVAAVQEEISREGRERKATKADDAEVPEYLWHEHVLEDCGRSWTDSQKKALPPAAQVLQKGMLKHWKQKVLTLFLTWLNRWHLWTNHTQSASKDEMEGGGLSK